VPNKRLEPEANCIGVRLRAGRRSGLSQQVLVDVERLFHPYDDAILIWLMQSCCGDRNGPKFGPKFLVRALHGEHLIRRSKIAKTVTFKSSGPLHEALHVDSPKLI
jgi:hypothetical protein